MQTASSNVPCPKAPLVSFVVTFYNLPVEWLKECLDSILNLSLSASERQVLVVDDGSDASPLAELASYMDSGIGLAAGKYVQFVDGDDKIISGEYEHCLDIVRYNDPDVVMFRSTSGAAARHSAKEAIAVGGPAFMAHNNIRAAAWGYIFRKEMLGGLRFTPGLLHEDEEFTPQLLLRAVRLFDTDYEAYFYRIRQQSIITSKDRKHILRRLNDFEYVLLRLNAMAATLSGVESEAMRRRVSQLTMDYIFNIATLTSSGNQMRSRLERLRQAGLFPLPGRNYSRKYALFSKVANNKVGLFVLMNALAAFKSNKR